MSDHNFERQVQQKMGELKLSPSANVWQGVEKSLDQNKRRRRGLIWIPLLILGLIGSGVFTYRQMIPSPGSVSSIQPETSSSQNKNSSVPIDASDLAKNDLPAQKIRDIKPVEQIKTEEPENVLENQPGQKFSIEKNQLHNHRSAEKNKQRFTEGQAVNMEHLLQETIVKSTSPARADNRQKANFDSEVKSEDELTLRTATIQNAKSLNRPINVLDLPSKPDNHISELSAFIGYPHVTKSAKSTLEFGALLSGGMAGVNSGGIFNVYGSQVADISMSAPLNAFAPSGGGGVIYKASPIRPGLSLSMGAYLKKELSRRWALSAGLSYTRFTASVDVGMQVNNQRTVNNGARGFYNVNMFYTPGNSERINMKYQFIDLPVSIHYKLINSIRYPISVSGGLVLSRMFKTDALHFDGTSGAYYRDNSLFNKNQLGLISGFSVQLFNRSKTPVTVGPSFRYQLSNLLQKDVSGSKHILGASLDLRIAIKK